MPWWENIVREHVICGWGGVAFSAQVPKIWASGYAVARNQIFIIWYFVAWVSHSWDEQKYVNHVITLKMTNDSPTFCINEPISSVSQMGKWHNMLMPLSKWSMYWVFSTHAIVCIKCSFWKNHWNLQMQVLECMENVLIVILLIIIWSLVHLRVLEGFGSILLCCWCHQGYFHLSGCSEVSPLQYLISVTSIVFIVDLHRLPFYSFDGCFAINMAQLLFLVSVPRCAAYLHIFAADDRINAPAKLSLHFWEILKKSLNLCRISSSPYPSPCCSISASSLMSFSLFD